MIGSLRSGELIEVSNSDNGRVTTALSDSLRAGLRALQSEGYYIGLYEARYIRISYGGLRRRFARAK